MKQFVPFVLTVMATAPGLALETGVAGGPPHVVKVADSSTGEFCASTWVSCNMVLTAEHCVRAARIACSGASDPAACYASRLTVDGVAAIDVHAHGNRDLAFIEVLEATGRPQAKLSGCGMVDPTTTYQAIGFGPFPDPVTGVLGSSGSKNSALGVELKAPYVAGAVQTNYPSGNHAVTPSDVTCQGDSGGPLVVANSDQIAAVAAFDGLDPTISGPQPCGLIGPSGFDHFELVDLAWSESVLASRVDLSMSGYQYDSRNTCTTETLSLTDTTVVPLTAAQARDIRSNHCALRHVFRFTLRLKAGYDDYPSALPHGVTADVLNPQATVVARVGTVQFPLTAVLVDSDIDAGIEIPSPVYGGNPETFKTATGTYEAVLTPDVLSAVVAGGNLEIDVSASGTASLSGCPNPPHRSLLDLSTYGYEVGPAFETTDTPFIAGTCTGGPVQCPSPAATCGDASDWIGIRPDLSTCFGPGSPAVATGSNLSEIAVLGQTNRLLPFLGCHDLLDPNAELDISYTNGAGWVTQSPAASSVERDEFIGCIANGQLATGNAWLRSSPTTGGTFGRQVQQLLACGCVANDYGGPVVFECP